MPTGTHEHKEMNGRSNRNDETSYRQLITGPASRFGRRPRVSRQLSCLPHRQRRAKSVHRSPCDKNMRLQGVRTYGKSSVLGNITARLSIKCQPMPS